MIATTKGSDSTLPLQIWLPHGLAIGNLLVHVHTQTVYTRVRTAHALACVHTVHMHAHTCTQTLCPAPTHTGTHSHVGTRPTDTGATQRCLGPHVHSSFACDRLSFFLGFSTSDTFEKSRSGILWKYLILCVCVSTGIMDAGKKTAGVRCPSHHSTSGRVTPSRRTTAVLSPAAWSAP